MDNDGLKARSDALVADMLARGQIVETREMRARRVVVSDLALQGTPKQIDWAVKIRRAGLVEVELWLEDFERQCVQHNTPADQVEQARALYHGLRDKVVAQASAAWWIDRREMSAQALLKAVQ